MINLISKFCPFDNEKLNIQYKIYSSTCSCCNNYNLAFFNFWFEVFIFPKVKLVNYINCCYYSSNNDPKKDEYIINFTFDSSKHLNIDEIITVLL